MTLAATSVSVANALARNANDDDLLRLVIQAADNFSSLDNDEARAEFLREPAPTGDPRYDALLAGLAVFLVQRAGLPTTPDWTRDECRFLQRMWWVGLPQDSGRRAFVLQRTPAYFKARGVMFNTDNLASL